MRYESPKDDGTGWTEWVYPKRVYKMRCCDCGLVHKLKFNVILRGRENKDGIFMVSRAFADSKNHRLGVRFKAARDNRATAQIRRHRKNNGR